MQTYFRLLLLLLWEPSHAIRQISQRASLGYAALAAWVIGTLYILVISALAFYAQSAGFKAGVMGGSGPGLAGSWVSQLPAAMSTGLLLVLFTTVIYVPFAIVVANLFERRLTAGRALRENFGSTAASALSAVAVSLLVTLLPASIISWQGSHLPVGQLVGFFVLLIVIPLPIFFALMTIALRTIFNTGWAAAALVALLSFLSLFWLPILTQVFSFVCASPFLLLLIAFLLRDRIADLLQNQRSRQAFKQNLEAATLNPADSSAHYNLGLLYQQRGELDAAEASFKRAVEIDETEIDAHYQLGRIARERGRLPESISHFETVVRQAPTHSQHEIWREIARTYLEAKQYPDALRMLDRFIAERPSDAEGHYWKGQALSALGRTVDAEAEMSECIESVRTAPAYKYRREQEWLRLAEQFLRERRV
ncbi:MAG: tetratricopeptide repeat protein [Acidobacteriota bacterium]